MRAVLFIRLLAVGIALVACADVRALQGTATVGGPDTSAGNPGINTATIEKLTPEDAEKLICTDKVLRRVVLHSVPLPTSHVEIKNGFPVHVESLQHLRVESVHQVNGAWLNLNGLKELSSETARVLARHNGILDLDGLTALSPEAEQALAKQEGNLSLKGLTTLSSVPLAEKLAKQEGWLFLNGLTTLSDEAAQAIAQHKGCWLCLDGLTSLSDEAAEALGKHEGTLHLRGLITLSDGAAEALAECNGELSLCGLTTLSSVPLAEKLAKQEGEMTLTDLTTISREAAEVLAQHKGRLIFRASARFSFPYEAIAALGANPEIVWLEKESTCPTEGQAIQPSPPPTASEQN